MVAPWSAFWDRNFFAQTLTASGWLASPFVRGAVSGVGVITASAGLAELAGAFGLRRREPEPTETPGR
jgi:hypothetical protein